MTFNHIVLQNILRDKWTYVSYFLSSVFSILVFFLFLITAFHPMLDGVDPDSTLGITMIGSSMIVYVFSFVFIVYSMLAFLKKKMKSLGIFMISGASMKQIQKMIFRENIFIAFAAIVTSILFGLIISPLFLMAMKNVFGAEDFGMYFPIQAVMLTIVLFTILFLILSKFITKFIKKEEAVQLLKVDTTQEKMIKLAPIRLAVSILITAATVLCLKYGQSIDFIGSIVESLGVFFYVITFASLLLTIYLAFTQGMLFITLSLQKRRSYFKKINILFVSNLKAKGRSYAHIIFLSTILLLAVFIGTSVLYSTYHNVEESTESVYPYSLQYVSLPHNSSSQVNQDIEFIKETFEHENETYTSYQSTFKSDEERRIGFLSNTDFNSLGEHPIIDLDIDEYYVVAGYEGVIPDTELIKDYLTEDLKLTGIQEELILTTSLQNVYYVLPDKLYEALDYPENQVFAYELPNWTDKLDVIQKIEKEVDTAPDEHLVTSKVSLYDTEKFVKRISFFIGFMLSLIFLSAAMSILYFYLQTSLAGEREKYIGIRKIGLSLKEICSVVTKELAILIFIPFVFATVLLFTVLLSIRKTLSPAFFQMTMMGVGIFSVLFILSFVIIRKTYLKKIVE